MSGDATKFAFYAGCSEDAQQVSTVTLYTFTRGGTPAELVSHTTGPHLILESSPPDWSDDGSTLVWNEFSSGAAGLQDSTLRIWTGSGTPQSIQHDTGALDAAVSADGRYVVFQSAGQFTQPPGYYVGFDRILVLDRTTNATAEASSAADGGDPNDNSAGPAISPDSAFVGFTSAASNLVVGDTNGVSDTFIRSHGSSARAFDGGTQRATRVGL
jgi:hypothetical protein